MKMEIGSTPTQLKEAWPGQYKIFSFLEYVCSIPHIVFAITTLKDNGKPNINPHAWSCFQGDEGGFFAVMPGICQHTHTYRNIQRTGEFCVNFLSSQYFDALMKAIQENGDDADEFKEAGLSYENAVTIAAPRIKESFLTLECKAVSTQDISGAGITAMTIGRVLHVAAEEGYADGFDKRYADEGFIYNIHAPINKNTEEESKSALATLKIQRYF